MKEENLPFMEAVKLLADMYGMTVPEDEGGNDAARRHRERLHALNKEAARFFHACLMGPEGKGALRRSIICFAGTAILPSSTVLSTSTCVLRVSSESEAVISSMFPLRSKRKFSRIGSGDFAGIAFATAITPLSSSELEMISFIIIWF